MNPLPWARSALYTEAKNCFKHSIQKDDSTLPNHTLSHALLSVCLSLPLFFSLSLTHSQRQVLDLLVAL